MEEVKSFTPLIENKMIPYTPRQRPSLGTVITTIYHGIPNPAIVKWTLTARYETQTVMDFQGYRGHSNGLCNGIQ